jgi:glutamate-1-semialdehyde 2,1-aminomutase
MANGFSVACVAGRREVMEHGSIEFEGRERVFLLSTTHGAEMCGLSAFIETIAFMERHDVCGHVWRTGARFIEMFNDASRRAGTWPHVRVGGPACKPVLSITGRDGVPSMPLRTLFMQELLRNGVLMPQVTIAFRHDEAALKHAESAIGSALPIVAEGLWSGIDGLLEGPSVRPVFRRFS